jgi:hypothetical protein
MPLFVLFSSLLVQHPAPPWCDINVAAQGFVSQGTRVHRPGGLSLVLAKTALAGLQALWNHVGIGNNIVHANVTYGDRPLGEQVSVKHKPLIDLDTISQCVARLTEGCCRWLHY